MRTIPAGHPPVFGALAVAADVAAGVALAPGVALAAGVALATGAPEPSGAGALPRAPVEGGAGAGCAGMPALTGGLEGPAGGAGGSTVPPQALTEARRHVVILANSAAFIQPA